MFDPDWLSRRDEDELLELYDWSRSRQKEHRRQYRFGLAEWYRLMAIQTIDELGRYYVREYGSTAGASPQLSLLETPLDLNQDPAA